MTVIEIVNDDMPFLVNSVMGEIAERRLEVRLVAHPVFGVARNGGKLHGVRRARRRGGTRESFIHIHLAPIEDAGRARRVVRALAERARRGAAGGAGLAAMLERVNGIVAELKTNPPPLPVDEIAEAIQFLQWLLADNFTFLGVRDYALSTGTRSSRISTARSASCARASCACSGAATNCSRLRRRSWRFSRSRVR